MNVQLYTNKNWGGTVECTPGVIDAAAREAFNYGHCHVMALALHEATGWPLVAIWYNEDSYDDGVPGHVAVKHPNGDYVDVEGPYPEDSGPDDYYTISHTEMIDEDYVYWLVETEAYKAISDASRSMAQSIVKEIVDMCEQVTLDSATASL